MMTCLPGYVPGGEKNRNVTLEQLTEKLPFSKPEVTASKKARLGRMVASPDHTMRVVAAGHPDTPRTGLVILSRDTDERVRAWVLRNPNVPLELVESMRDDQNEVPMIRAAAKALAEKIAEKA